MNHIYKSIFNKALGVFTAVPEFASAHGKGSERTVVGRVAKGTAGFAASALAISVGLALTSTSAVAGPGIYVNDGTDNGCAAYIDTHNAYVGIFGVGSTVNVNNSMVKAAPGYKAPPDSYFALGQMKPCLSSIGANATEHRSTQTNRTLFYGNTPTASVKDNGAKNLTLGGRLDVNSGIIGVGDRGTNGAGATNSIRMGTGTTLDEANKKTNAISIGVNVGASADNAVAMGNMAKASAASAVAISNQANSKTAYSIALGDSAVAGDDSADALNGGVAAIAIGRQASANVYNGIALGKQATVKKDSSDGIAIGSETKVNAYKGTAIGAFSEANGSQSLAIGNNRQGQSSIASGGRSQVYGVESTVSGNNSVAIGDTNTVASARTYAIGNNINVAAGANDSLVFGTKAAVGGAEAIALGKTANSKTEAAISIGAYAVSGDGDPVSGAEELGKKSISIGYQSVANRYDTIAMGVLASTQAADSAVAPWDAVAIGSKSKATTYKALAIGAYSQATGRQSTVIGNDIKGQNSTASGTRSQILGVQSNVSGDNSVSIGDTNTIESARTYALGNNINVAAGADDSLAFGTRAAVGAANTVAIGANANAAQANSVALGAGSTTDNIHEGDYTLNDSYTAAGLPNAANGAVSVGSAGKERQIQNVAAGVISATSTDAINGSQLYATNNYINNFAGDVKTKLGGNAALGKDGHLTMTNIGGTGKDNVNDAIAAANTKVEAGDNISVTSTTNSDGSKTYTVATKKDLVVDSVKAGGTTVNTDGVTIANGPSITKSGGINANGRKVTGVVNGDINSTSTDAVNGSQLHATNTKLDNVANALADTHFVVDTKATTGGELDGTSQADQKIKSGNKVTLQAGKNLKAKQTNGTDGAQVEFSLKDSISLTQVTAGTGANQVVLGNDGVKVGDSTLNTDGLTIAGGPSVKKDGINAGNKKITGVADGNIAAGSTDAVNGGQLAEVKSKADSAVQKVVSANPTALTVTKAGDTVTLTPNFIAGDLVNPATGEVNTPAADDAGKLVTAGTVSKALAETHFVVDTKATTGGELDGASQANQKIKSSNKVTLQAGKNLKAKQTNGTDGAQVEFSLKDSISLTQVTAGTGDNQVVLGNDGVQVGGNTYINKDGLNANSKPISNVADGVKSKDAVNKGQLDAVAQEAAKHTTVKAGKNVEVSEGTNAAGGKEYTVKTADNLNVTSVKAGDSTLNTDGLTIAGGPSVKKDGINAGNKKITGVADGNVAPGSTDAVNGGQLHDTAKSMADVIGGGATVKDGKVVAGQNGIGNTGQNTVHGAIAAINQNTANNFNQIRGDLRKMDRDLRGSIAGTLATAGLPQAFSPGKSMVAAAAGTYRGQSGLAIGVSRISDNGKVILKVTGNTNSRGDFGGTIGAGYQW